MGKLSSTNPMIRLLLHQLSTPAVTLLLSCVVIFVGYRIMLGATLRPMMTSWVTTAPYEDTPERNARSITGFDPTISVSVATAVHSDDYAINCRERCRASSTAKRRASSASAAVNSELFLLIVVHSALDHFERRARIRRTWANESVLLTSPSIKSRDSIGIRMETVFVVGRSPLAAAESRHRPAVQRPLDAVSVQSQLEDEAVRYGDILQGNFIDTYRNMTEKALTTLRWIVAHCNSTTFVMKTDDDAFVNIFTVVRHLIDLHDVPDRLRTPRADPPLHKTSAHSTSPSVGVIMGLVWKDPPVARRGKWAVTMTEMPDSSYPPYCAGVGYVMTSDVPGRLLQQNDAIFLSSGGRPPFWIDDVYVTGTLVRGLNGSVRLVDMRKAYCKPEKMKAVFRHPSEWYKYAFAHLGGLDDRGNSKSALFEETWSKLVEMASRNKIARPTPLRPGRLANCYIKSFRKILRGNRLDCRGMKKSD